MNVKNAVHYLKQKGLIINAKLIGDELTSDVQNNSTPFKDQLLKDAQNLGVLDQLEFAGFTSDVYESLADIEVVVLPSDSEGVPNCILEAMSLRKLVIASVVGGIPEMIKDGVNGLLHPPQDHESFAAKMELVFTSPAEDWDDLRNAAYKTWYEKFRMERMMEKLINVYREVGVLND